MFSPRFWLAFSKNFHIAVDLGAECSQSLRGFGCGETILQAVGVLIQCCLEIYCLDILLGFWLLSDVSKSFGKMRRE
jgi:hypothetical protein